MPGYNKIFLPFRLKLLAVILAAAGAGIYLSYGGFCRALKPFYEEEAGNRLLSRVELTAAVLDESLKGALETASLTAARTGLREILARHNTNAELPSDAADLARRLADAAAAANDITGLDLAGVNGKITASLEKSRLGLNLATGQDFRSGPKGSRVGAPRAERGELVYDVTVQVPALKSSDAPLGTLRCRFRLTTARQGALRTLLQNGAIMVLAKKNARNILLIESARPAREVSLKVPEGAAFLPALSGREGASAAEEGSSGRMLYAWRTIPDSDWIIAAKTPFRPGSENFASLLERARLSALLAFVLLAAAAFFASGLLTAPLGEAGRQAAALLEQCGKTGAHKNLCEPRLLAGAIEDAAGLLKKQSSRDLELETETEKLREEEADLKSQNDELEKLNKYLMERETKISELKKEISDLREKVGGGVQD